MARYDRLARLACIGALIAAPVSARQILVSAEDGKPVRPGDAMSAMVPDALRILAVEPGGLRSLATLAVPASMTGPPESVKLTPDGRYAVVSASQALAPGATPTLVPGDAVSLVDLSVPARPRLIETVHAGAGASGVAIGADGRLVLVANARAGSVSMFALADGHLVARGTVTLPAGSRPVSARVAPDGRSALVVAGVGRIFRLRIAGDTATLDPTPLDLGKGASDIALSPDGGTAYISGSGDDADHARVTAIDTARLRITATASLPPAAEGLALSRSGRFLEVTLLDGTNRPPGDPKRRETGTLAVLSTAHGGLRLVAQTPTGRLCQGAAWRDDERRIFLQCADDRSIESYAFDGRATLRRLAPTLSTEGRGGALAIR